MTILTAIKLLKKYNYSQKRKAKKSNTDISEVDQALSTVLAFLGKLEDMQFIITEKTAGEILVQGDLMSDPKVDWQAYDINGSLWGFFGDRPIATKGTWKTPRGCCKIRLHDWTFEEMGENGAYLNYEDSLKRIINLTKDDLIDQS